MRGISLLHTRPHAGKSSFLRRSLRCGLLLVVTAVATPALPAAAKAKSPPALQGKLLSIPGKGPVLRTSVKDYPMAGLPGDVVAAGTMRVPGKDYPLLGRTSYMLHTLLDKRLEGREVRVEGSLKPDGAFEVEWLFTIRNGKLYQVRYLCEVCNIKALEPGKCVCCQQPTELQEVPVSDRNK